jgi:NADH dehydrogenase [ubiquinone] 1 alpha subcomplex assembly factor 7
MQLGLPLRLEGVLKEAKTDEQRQEIRNAAATLVDPTGMWKEYQIMGITSNPLEKMKSASAWPFPAPGST